MKKLTFAALLLTLAAYTAAAQNAFDLFAGPRTLVVAIPTVNTTAGFTNVVDTHGFDGICKLDVCLRTNTSASEATIYLYGSSNPTNSFTALSYVAAATRTAEYVTNNFIFQSGSTSNAYYLTNYYNLAGTLTTTTPSSSGFAIPSGYIVPAPFTNSGSFRITTDSVNTYGWNISDAPRYLMLGVASGGAGTNVTISAVLTAKRAQ